VEGISEERARTVTYEVKTWAGRLAEDMGSLHKLLSAPVQWTLRGHSSRVLAPFCIATRPRCRSAIQSKVGLSVTPRIDII
jgi:hypothetical protein